MQKVSLGLVIVALLVTAPRLIIAFIIGDGITIGQNIEVVLLIATGIGSGIVLTVGNAILAHALAEKSRHKGLLWWVLLLAWISFLCSAIIVVSPTLVTGLRKSPLIDVLPSVSAQWFWAITAVAVIEILVGASITASILESEQDAPKSNGENALGRLGNALIRRIEYKLDPGIMLAQTTSTVKLETNGSLPQITQAMTNSEKKRLRHQELIQVRLDGDDLDIPAFAEQHGVTPQTVYRDIKEIQDKMVLGDVEM